MLSAYRFAVFSRVDVLKSIRSFFWFLPFAIQFRWSIERDQGAAGNDNADDDPLDILDQLAQAQV